jgi:glycerophosphoryl diester phosphodiesterase
MLGLSMSTLGISRILTSFDARFVAYLKSMDYFALPKPRILCHRGLSQKFAENSLAAFKAALAYSPYIETDLWATRDRVPVLHHDEDLRRSCGIPQKISELDYAELEKLRIFGSSEKIPTLAQALQTFPEAVWNIEIKDDVMRVEKEVVEIIQKAGQEKSVLIAAEKDSIIKRFRLLSSKIRTSASFQEMLQFVQWLQQGGREPFKALAEAFQIPTSYEGLRLDQPELLGAAHSLGVEVHYWTVNDVSEARRLLALGADGIVTDNPAELSSIAKEFIK